MTVLASSANPEVLRWARERAGYSVQEIATALNKDVSLIQGWESSDSGEVPTYAQLEMLAYRYYKRPLALFFFPAPPDEVEPRQSFRTLPDAEIDRLLPDTLHVIRMARAMQIALMELNDGVNPALRRIFEDMQPTPDASVGKLTTQVRDYLSVELEQQVNCRTAEDAFKLWRDAVQQAGIFVFKQPLKQEDVSGFCLLHDEFPVIYVNNSTPATRQIFTLFHELSHILLRTNGITKQDDTYLRHLSGYNRDVEVFCNQFAAEFLVPSADFERHIVGTRVWNERAITKVADRYNVSREVILRKLLDRGLVEQDYYEVKSREWAGQSGKRGKGGDYYLNQITYLGDKYLELAFGRYYAGRCSLESLSDYLNVAAKSIVTLEAYLEGRGSSG